MIRIAVLFHEQDRHPEGYVVHHLANVWRKDGHDVRYLFGTGEFVPADILLVHVNLSVVPDHYLRFARKYPIALNDRIADIRKRTVSSNLVTADDSWNGPVIAKSNLNYGGLPERWFTRPWIERQIPPLRRLRHRYEWLRSIGMPRFDSESYPIFESIRAVPRRWLRSPDIVIEKFRPELEGGRYHLRIYQVLGDRWTCTRLASEQPVIKAGGSIAAEEVAPHPAVEQWRREHHMDYGKIDYVVCDGEPVLLDINKTTGATSGFRPAPALEAARRHLAEGLYSYVDGGSLAERTQSDRMA
jgi:hypothetical protein